MSLTASVGGRRWIPALAFGVACAAHGAPNDAASWLQRAIQAARNASYSGTYAHSNGDRTSAVRITHVTVGNEEHERIEPLDGPPLEIVRRNDEMFCYFPDAKTIRLDRRVTAHFFPALLSASSPEAVAASYDLKLGKTESALGFDCQWVRLEPRDNLRYAQSLCAETHSGLVIRAKTFNAQNQVIEQYTFTELKIGPQVARSDVKSLFEARVKRWFTDAPASRRGEERGHRLDRERPAAGVPQGDGAAPHPAGPRGARLAIGLYRWRGEPVGLRRGQQRPAAHGGGLERGRHHDLLRAPHGRHGGVGPGGGPAVDGPAGGARRRTPAVEIR